MDATCAIQASIHVFSLVRKYVSRILGTYQMRLHGIFLIVKRFYTDFTFPLFLILHSDFTMQLWLRDGEHESHDNIERNKEYS